MKYITLKGSERFGTNYLSSKEAASFLHAPQWYMQKSALQGKITVYRMPYSRKNLFKLEDVKTLSYTPIYNKRIMEQSNATYSKLLDSINNILSNVEDLKEQVNETIKNNTTKKRES